MGNNYALMPEHLKKVCELFEGSNLKFNLFKCEHILEGKNKNLDILFMTIKDYDLAGEMLENEGYVLYLPEKVEKYKKMYVKHGTNLSAVHLHREVAWHGVIAMDKRKIFERAEESKPSKEDSMLIHSAHAIFENFQVSDFHREVLLRHEVDMNYVKSQLKQSGWEEPFRSFQENFKVSKKVIVQAYAARFTMNPGQFLSALGKVTRAGMRKLSLRRRGYCIALIGMNGAGKSTTKEAVLRAYKPLSDFIAGQQGYYFGWKQSAFSKKVGKAVSGDKKLFDKVSKEKVKKFDLFQELVMIYMWSSFWRRYIIKIYPNLRKGKLVVTDRYFYDMYGQYPYSDNSVVLKILPIPKPDKVFLLNAEVEMVKLRDKGGVKQREVQPDEKLRGQQQRYLEIASKIKADIINAGNDFDRNVAIIVNNTWKKFVHGIHKPN